MADKSRRRDVDNSVWCSDQQTLFFCFPWCEKNNVCEQANTAAHNYEKMGGQLTWFPSFGVDPIADSLETQQQRNEFFMANFDVAAVFSSVVNGVPEPFRQAIHHFFSYYKGHGP